MVKTVLLIDDNPDILLLITLMLKHHDFSVLTANDGDEGVRSFFSTKPDTVIVDIDMPKKNGYDVIREIRGASHDVKILICTAASCVKHIDGVDILRKPFSSSELYSKVCTDDKVST
jgi:DNA-binding response OmpR family regulator